MTDYKQAWVFTFRNGDVFLVVVLAPDRPSAYAKALETFSTLEPWDHATYPCDPALPIGVTQLK